MSLGTTAKKVLNHTERMKTFNDFNNKAAKKVVNKSFRRLSGEEIENLSNLDFVKKYFGVEMTKPAAMVGGLAIAGTMVGSGLLQQNHKGKLGEVRGAQIANSIESNTSPLLNKKLEEFEDNPESASTFGTTNLSKSQSGADAEIVFALHELRNGEGV